MQETGNLLGESEIFRPELRSVIPVLKLWGMLMAWLKENLIVASGYVWSSPPPVHSDVDSI